MLSVYTPLYAGVYWDVQNVLLEDIERIEVIRGPGGTIWGSNAVNGVINVITKNAKETQGTYASTIGGNLDQNESGVRYGAGTEIILIIGRMLWDLARTRNFTPTAMTMTLGN